MSSDDRPTMTLGYTNEDNGIWLWCELCRNYVTNLGFSPSPHDAVRAESAHWATHDRKA